MTAVADQTGEIRRAVREACGEGELGIAVRRSSYATTFPLHEVDVRTASRMLRLVYKRLDLDRLDANARAAKPAGLHDAQRERQAYEVLLRGTALQTPRCHASGSSGDGATAWLLLERVEGPRLLEVGDMGVWERAAAQLATLHDALAPLRAGATRALDLATLGWHRWASAAVRNVTVGPHPAGQKRRLAAVLERYDTVADRLAALPRSVLHGDCYPPNVVVAGERICFLDWEMTSIGPRALDLAALTAGAWAPEQRRALARAYWNAAEKTQPFEELLADLLRCRLHVCLQWLGWPAAWQAPPESRHDWLGDALAAAEELGL